MMIIPIMKQALFATGCFLGALLWIGRSSSNGDYQHRRLGLESHWSGPDERNIQPMFDTSTMQLMSSPCRPETDGYFGSTSGTPLEIQFGFELETEDDDNIDFLLDEIQEQIVDMVLSSSFPNLCGYRRRQERERHLGMRGLSLHESKLKAKPRTTGFRFDMDIHERTGAYERLGGEPLVFPSLSYHFPFCSHK
jgi:hypothetical protein